ncbi:DNA polymerase III subunit chi [Vibrio sp. RC27]
MKNATFYLIQPNTPQATVAGLGLYVVFLGHHFTKQGAKVYVHCDDRQAAEALAEVFWQAPADNYVAHNLVGEGPKYGTPIEIGFEGIRPSWNRQIVINCSNKQATFADRFTEVIDFVPCEENAKQLARERYKIYRHAGFNIDTLDIQHS